MKTRRKRIVSLPVLILAALLPLIIAALGTPQPSDAMGAEFSWRKSDWPGCGGGYNSGTFDAQGRLYIPCEGTVGIYDYQGEFIEKVDTGGAITEVVPTSDGRYFYAVAPGAQPRRFAKSANGSWSIDTNWSPQGYPVYGSPVQPRGGFAAVDHSGNFYLADGAWSPNNAHTVLVYAPDGTLITRFGEWGHTWQPGYFYWMIGGLAVTPDGSKVYTVEVGNNRIQVWNRQSDGSYAVNPSEGWGGTELNNPDREGYCDFGAWVGKFAAPYDVALDAAGNVYVVNTTCKQVMRFTADGTYLEQADIRVNGGDYPRPHGFAVAADGTVYIGENSAVLRKEGAADPANGAAPSFQQSRTPQEPEPQVNVTTSPDPQPTQPPNQPIGSAADSGNAFQNLLQAQLARTVPIEGEPWPSTTIRYFDATPASYRWSINKAIESWNTIGLPISFVKAANKDDADVVISEDTSIKTPGVSSVGYLGGSQGYVKLNRNYGAKRDRYSLAMLAAHELGHTLSLGHPSNASLCSVLNPLFFSVCEQPKLPWQWTCRLPQAADLDALKSAYGGTLVVAPKQFCPRGNTPALPAKFSAVAGTTSAGRMYVRLSWKRPKGKSARFVDVQRFRNRCSKSTTPPKNQFAWVASGIKPTSKRIFDQDQKLKKGRWCYRLYTRNSSFAPSWAFDKGYVLEKTVTL